MKEDLEKKIGPDWVISRRDFLTASGVGLVSGLLFPWGARGTVPARKLARTVPWRAALGQAVESDVRLRFGLVTDIHYADIDSGGFGGNRHYRESLAKLRECVGLMNQKKVEFLCELGDFKDQDVPPKESSTLQYLRVVDHEFKKFEGPRHYVFGNHDFDSISKEQFKSVTGAKAGYYSFDEGGVHFVLLDACFDSEGKDYDHGGFNWMDTNVSQAELEWLAGDLAKAGRPTVVFVHQRLDGGQTAAFVRNAAEVRKVLEDSGKVLAVFQGHDHAGGYEQIRGIHYYTLKGVVEGSGEENNTYAIVEVLSAGGMTVTGYRKAVSKEFSA